MSIKCLFGFHVWRKATACKAGVFNDLLVDVLVCHKCGRTKLDLAGGQKIKLASGQ